MLRGSDLLILECPRGWVTATHQPLVQTLPVTSRDSITPVSSVSPPTHLDFQNVLKTPTRHCQALLHAALSSFLDLKVKCFEAHRGLSPFSVLSSSPGQRVPCLVLDVGLMPMVALSISSQHCTHPDSRLLLTILQWPQNPFKSPKVFSSHDLTMCTPLVYGFYFICMRSSLDLLWKP